jgi:hypothetical protein
VGSGFLVWGGSSNGGRRGGFWLGARRAFENTGVLRLRKDAFRGDFFYLTPNDNPNTNTDVVGTNLEYDITDWTEIGFMYLNVLNSERVRRDDLDVFNFRGKTRLASLPGLQLNGELALRRTAARSTAPWVDMWASLQSLRSCPGTPCQLSFCRLQRRPARQRNRQGLRSTVFTAKRLGHLVPR